MCEPIQHGNSWLCVASTKASDSTTDQIIARMPILGTFAKTPCNHVVGSDYVYTQYTTAVWAPGTVPAPFNTPEPAAWHLEARSEPCCCWLFLVRHGSPAALSKRRTPGTVFNAVQVVPGFYYPGSSPCKVTRRNRWGCAL